jgi:hypothetical protein
MIAQNRSWPCRFISNRKSEVVDNLPNQKVIIRGLKCADMIWILNLWKGGLNPSVTHHHEGVKVQSGTDATLSANPFTGTHFRPPYTQHAEPESRDSSKVCRGEKSHYSPNPMDRQILREEIVSCIEKFRYYADM